MLSQSEKRKKRSYSASFKYSLANTLFAVAAAFAIGILIMLAIGADPFDTYYQMISQSLFTFDGLMRTFHVAAPLILTGLAIAVTFKANLFNMGVEGQMLLGGFCTAIVGSHFQNLPAFLHVLVCLLLAMLCGMVFALIPACLKAYYKVDEMVVTLMLNYATVEILTFLSEGVFRDPTSGYVSTATIQDSAMFSKLLSSDLTSFFFIAILMFCIIYVLFKYTRLGLELKALGQNVNFAEATGMNVKKKIIILFLISGALSGLAGAGWMMSEKFRYTLSFSGNPGLGWDGMLISLLGAHSPLGVLIAAFFYSSLKVGMSKIELFTNVPGEIISVIQAFMILFLSVTIFSLKKSQERKARKEQLSR